MHVDHRYIFRSWIQGPVVFTYGNGYRLIDNYPYYVHSGFRYGYSPVERCQYQLVNSDVYSSVQNTGLIACNQAYDQCALQRDNYNRVAGYEQHICAEGVDYDLRSTVDSDYSRYPVDMNDQRESSISSYLPGQNYLSLFNEASVSNVGNCRIEIAPSNSSCSYLVRVGNDIYPQVDGSVCSDDDSADQIRCNVGNEQENAGCILQAAIQEGYCL